MTEAARLVDELTTLLYEVIKRWQLQDGRVCEIVACGACRRKADKPESVVHDSDCPVYRLIRAEAANTAVIRANAEEIADLEDVRDELEATFNGVVAEIEHERKMFASLTDASVRRIDALTTERDALRARAERAADQIMQDVLDLDPDDPEHPDTICISYDALVVVLDNALRGADAAMAAASEGE